MKLPVADRIFTRLKGFAEALENDEVISHRFTCRKVILDLEPRRYDAELVRRTRRLIGLARKNRRADRVSTGRGQRAGLY
jgi:hypothetical protein